MTGAVVLGMVIDIIITRVGAAHKGATKIIIIYINVFCPNDLTLMLNKDDNDSGWTAGIFDGMDVRQFRDLAFNDRFSRAL